MRYLRWAIWLFLFILLLGFAIKNTEAVNVRFYFNTAWQSPLILLLFLFFTAGALFGIMAMLPQALRLSRELSKIKRDEKRAIPPKVVATPINPIESEHL